MVLNCTQIDSDGYARIEWMFIMFGECVHTPMEQASFYIGLSSIMFWIFANFPQIYENYKNGNASSLHIAFLIQWILGDSLNAIGAILTGQLTTQILTGIYFVSMDVILIAQWIYYMMKNRIKSQNEETLEDGEESQAEYESKSLLRSVLWIVVLLMFFGSISNAFSNEKLNYQQLPLVKKQNISGRKLMQMNMQETKRFNLEKNPIRDDDNDPGVDSEWPPKGFENIFGYVIGCLSTALYLGSRIPQIFKNFRRRSTEGLSIMLFFCAFMVNTTYSVSILLFSRKRSFILNKLPWIIGSAGVLSMDFLILMQFLLFRTKNPEEREQNDRQDPFLQNIEEESDENSIFLDADEKEKLAKV